MSEIAISLKNVSKCYKRYAHPVDRLKELLLPGKSRVEEFWALQGIDLEVSKGETLAVVGRNGSGKSTLLQIIAGTLSPTTGKIWTQGRISALLELGSGFNPEFTGRQNVFFNGRLLGLSQREIEDKFDQIAGFADIGDFLDQPVKTYSSGMFIRLAFAVAIHSSPDIFIVDEALSVGDMGFQRKSFQRIEAIKDSGTTILLVSHDISSVKRYANEVVLIHQGKIRASGNSNYVIHEYIKLIDADQEVVTNQEVVISSQQPPKANKRQVSQSEVRYGNGNATIEQFTILDLNNEPCDVIQSGETYILEWHIHFHETIEKPCTGVYLKTINGFDLFSTNTYLEKFDLPRQLTGSAITVRFKQKLPLTQGNYVLGFGLSDMANDKITPLDRRYDALCFRVVGRMKGVGVLDLNPEIEVKNFVTY